ncbi:hypothetical protein EON79_20255 [bacterium]|nr:MAG: hypothetical protein EON79_20255 [bacterium]
MLFVLGGSVLGALGLARIRAAREHPETKTWGDGPILAMALLAIVLTFGLSLLVPPNTIGLDPDVFVTGKASLVLALVPAAGLVLALLLLVSRRIPARFGVLVAGLPALHALVTYAPGLVPTGVMPPLPAGAPLIRVAVVNDRWNFFATPRAIVPPNLLAAAKIVDTGGYDSLIDRETKEILDRVNGADSPPPENGNMMFVRSTANVDQLRSLGVGELWSRTPINGLPILGEENGVVRQRVGGSLLQVEGNMGSETASAFRLRPDGIDAPAGGAARVSALWRNLPGWTLNGQPVAEGPFLSGSATGSGPVEFRYTPPGLRIGLAVSGAGLLALLVLFAVSGRSKGKPEVV